MKRGHISMDAGDARNWLDTKLSEGLRWEMGLSFRTPVSPVSVYVRLVQDVRKGVALTVAEEHEPLYRQSGEAVLGAMLRCAARLHGKLEGKDVHELIKLARWNADTPW